MFKSPLLIATLFILATSCSTVRPGASRPAASTNTSTSKTSSGSVEFIDNIAINPSGKPAGNEGLTPVRETKSQQVAMTTSAESMSTLQVKYAILENASVEELNNAKLLSFMEYWYGTPYHYGGTTRDGIDCSAFAILLMSSVYGVASLPRTSKEQYESSHHIGRDELQEGDLVFFHTLGKGRIVTHVGVYLRNNKFIHASVSGVMISDLSDGYYHTHYIGAGRVLDTQAVGVR